MRIGLKIVRWIGFLFVLSLVGFLVYKIVYPSSNKVVITEDVLVEKISNIGKLELIKYSMRDVIEKKELRSLLPDKRVLLVASGEVAGCIDLTRIKTEDIVQSTDDSITIYLPQPEICYVKLDHQRSKIYDVSGSFFPEDTKDMVEDIYKLAEQRLLENAKSMDILGQTRTNANVIFKPMLERLASKKVGIKFH